MYWFSDKNWLEEKKIQLNLKCFEIFNLIEKGSL